MRLIHPSTKKLRHWLDHGGNEGVDAHVSECTRCANRLEELATPVPELAAALALTLQTPDDLVQRLGVRMTESMRTREDLAIMLDLMGIPIATIRNLMSEDDT